MTKLTKKHLFTREKPIINRKDIEDGFVKVEDIIPQNHLLTKKEEEKLIIMAVEQKESSCPVDSTLVYYKDIQEFLFASRIDWLSIKELDNIEVYHLDNMQSILTRYDKKYKSWFKN